jgi:hypothetical protein
VLGDDLHRAIQRNAGELAVFVNPRRGGEQILFASAQRFQILAGGDLQERAARLRMLFGERRGLRLATLGTVL